MAKARGKKPSDIIDVIHDIVSPWLGTPPGQHSSVTQGQQLARGAAETLDQVYAGGMIKAGVQGDKALAKQAAINAAALGAGYVASKVVQKAIPLVRSKIGREIGVHISNADRLKKITYSPERAGMSRNYDYDVEPGATYKFAPYIDVYDGGEIYGRMGMNEFAEKVAANNLQMSHVSGNPTKKFAYITKSKVGELDEDWASTNAFVTGEQKVLQKVELPQIIVGNENVDYDWLAESDANYNTVSSSLLSALSRQQTLTATNTQQAINTARVAAGVATQQGLKKKGRGSGTKKK